jgi:two-component system chemotaxis response regulator CheB
VLLVDDSDVSRGELGRILEDAGHLVLAQARDGEEALRLALTLQPDAILLDLQMPRMDGFTFLRLLMGRRPTPVLVLSSQSRRSDVFKTLELGALDFVAKPEGGGLSAVRQELLAKLALVRALRLDTLAPRPAMDHDPAGPPPLVEPPGVVVIGASTGGPRAVQELLSSMPAELPVGFLVAQHMPEKFTRAFAERLGRTTAFSVAEAVHGDVVAAGRVLVAPGGSHLELRRDHGPGDSTAAYCPSVDRLFTSAVQASPRRLCAVILTGMGNDGTAGIQAVRAAGGLTLAEAEESAVVYGMPNAAVASGAVDEVLGLPSLAARLVRFARNV